MQKKIWWLMFITLVVCGANAYRQPYVFDLDALSPFFTDTSRIIDRMCRDNFLATDIKSEAEKYKIKIDVPGIKKNDIKAILKESILYIEVNVKENYNEGEYILRERSFGENKISRSFKLRDADPNGEIKSELKKGVLFIEVQKNKQKTVREIKIM